MARNKGREAIAYFAFSGIIMVILCFLLYVWLTMRESGLGNTEVGNSLRVIGAFILAAALVGRILVCIRPARSAL